jgi:ANTAR domain
VENRDIWLAETLVDLAETADADCGEGAYTALVGACVAELTSPAEVGMLLTGASGTTMVAAASSRRANDLVSFEEMHREGPATDCLASGDQILNESLARAAARWPGFAPTASTAGFALVSGFPMRRQLQTIGAIIVFDRGRPLTVSDANRVQIIAKAAAITVAQQREFRQSVLAATQLQRALNSRVVIEQAKGAVAARLDITPEAAFVMLRSYARRESRPLPQVAEQTMRGELAIGDLVSAHPGTHGQRVTSD